MASQSELGVLLIGSDFQAVGVLHALHAAGIPVFLVQDEVGIAPCSRFAKRRKRKYDLLSADDGVDFLCRLADEHNMQGWAIFCVNDETVEFLAKNHQQLSEQYVVAVPPWEITRNFYEKDRAYQLADAHHIPVPRTYSHTHLGDLLDATIAYPIVLKPTFKKNYYEKTNDKARLIENEDELVAEYQAMNQLIPSSQIVVQEFLAGGTRNLYSFAALFDGEQVVSSLSAARLRQHPMDFGHATTFAESRDIPELEGLATQFLAALGYRGVAEVEFMFDERTSEYKFLEMNGRFWGWHTLTQHAGLNFPRDLFRMLQGYEVERKMPVCNMRWKRSLTDGPTLIRELFRGRLSVGALVSNLLQFNKDAVWSWRDPMPFLAEVLIAPYLWWKKGF